MSSNKKSGPAVLVSQTGPAENASEAVTPVVIIPSGEDLHNGLDQDSNAGGPAAGTNIPAISRPETNIARATEDIEPFGDGKLHRQHAELIKRSGISPEVARARGYRTIETKAECGRLGFNRSQCSVPALLIPLYDSAGNVAGCQIRPDNPRISGSGKPLKYESPKGSRNVVDVPPGARKMLQDPSYPLFITEGSRKADAAVSHGLCCVSISGVYGFRGRNQYGGSATLPDWEQIPLKRDVYIVFDSDVMTKHEVHAAMKRLKALLEHRGASVQLIYLPSGAGARKVGLDDYFADGHSVDELLSHASAEVRGNSDSQGEPVRYRATPKGIEFVTSMEATGHRLISNFCSKIVAEIWYEGGFIEACYWVIETVFRGETKRIEVPSNQFDSLSWIDQIGSGAVIYPGGNNREHLRVATRRLGEDVIKRFVHAHTGWLEKGDIPIYLHSGGAIGPDGPVDGIEVELPAELKPYRLQIAPDMETLRLAVKDSLQILDLAPDRIVFPIYASIWRAVLGTTDYSLHLAGPSGAGKSALAALVQQHWGAELDGRHLAASWASTSNALEALCYQAKDAIVVVDDFAPAPSLKAKAEMAQKAEAVFRGRGNLSGRQRLGSDLRLQKTMPPRGFVLSTGEDSPEGLSLRSRILIIEMGPKDLRFDRLTHMQGLAANGIFAQALAGYLQWLAPRRQGRIASLEKDRALFRSEAMKKNQHRRTPQIYADLRVGMEDFLAFAQDIGAINACEAEGLRSRALEAFSAAAAAQAQIYEEQKPTKRYFELLHAAITSGRAHIAGPDGRVPANPESWGYRAHEAKDAIAKDGMFVPQGPRIGWVDGDNVYLLPDAAYSAAESMARAGGGSLGIQMRTLNRHLNGEGLLISTEHGSRNTYTTRVMVNGKRLPVIHISAIHFGN